MKQSFWDGVADGVAIAMNDSVGEPFGLWPFPSQHVEPAVRPATSSLPVITR